VLKHKGEPFEDVIAQQCIFTPSRAGKKKIPTRAISPTKRKRALLSEFEDIVGAARRR